MGVDIYHCESCKENLHCDYFPTCVACEENPLCDECINQNNYIKEKKMKFYICNDCIHYSSTEEIIKGLNNYGCKMTNDECTKKIKKIIKSVPSKIDCLNNKLKSLDNEIKKLTLEKERIENEIKNI